MQALVFLIATVLASPSQLSDALRDAQYGTRMPGDTIVMTGFKQGDGREFSFAALPHNVRVLVFVEPLEHEAGLKRLAWWQANAKALASLADVIAVPSASPRLKAAGKGLVMVDDPDCLLAARFGAIRPYDGRLGALPLAFVLDEHGIIRATIEPGLAKDQLKPITAAVQRLRRQLSRQAQSY